MFDSRKIGTLILLLMLATPLLLIPNSIIDTSNAAPQSGFFESDVTLYGGYLQTINCYPLQGRDENDDGILDTGFSSDWDRDGTKEQHKVEDPLIVDLNDNGFYPGDKIMISYKESVYDTNQVFWWFYLYGLFSSSPNLLTDNWDYTPTSGGDKWPMVGPVNRVPGAIDAELGGYIHQPEDNSNYGGGQGRQVENDIPEDFRIGGRMAYNVDYNPFGGKWTDDDDLYGFRNGFWMTIPSGANYLFFQVVGAWMLSESGYCTVTIDKDTDGDALPDSWEKGGIDFNKDGTTDLTLPDADFKRKDLYVEIDYMGAGGGCPGHLPDAGAISDVKLAFNNAPGESVKNPDGSEGINLHLNVAEADVLPHNNPIRLWDDFDQIKNSNFGTETQRNNPNAKWVLLTKKYTYRYCLFIHQREKWNGTHWVATKSSGLAESWKGCNDFLVSLGATASQTGTTDEQAATFMHEFGHTLGLGHGGNNMINYKPNYLSIMNYLFQFDSNVKNRPLDYSRMELATLDESDLDELLGFGLNSIGTYSQPWYQTGFSLWNSSAIPHPDQFQRTLLMPIDWNNDTSIDPGIQANVNHFPKWKYTSPAGEKLKGCNDWKNLKYHFQDSDHFADGIHPEEELDEITWDIAQEIEEAWNQFDPLPIPEPDPSDSPYEPDEDETSTDILPIIGIVAVVIAAILLIVFLILRRRKKTTEKS